MMDITQNIWGFVPEEEGEAVIVYTMTAGSGASASVTNIGAALVSVLVPDRDGILTEMVADSAPVVVNRVWDARVEINRVVFSTTHATSMGTLALEVAYHFGEDGELEIVFSVACDSDVPMEVDLAPRTRFNLSEEDHCFEVEGWRKNILAEAGSVTNPETGIEMAVLTSLPKICVYGSGEKTSGKASGEVVYVVPPIPASSGISVSADPTALSIAPGERQIQKVVYKFSSNL